ncbi:Acyl-CoA reductase (LuxC) [Pectobacterium versatile]|nr:Acyl-CoA reductase (LuxC) [Pectobacterium versatile]
MTHMPHSFDGVSFLVGNPTLLEDVRYQRALKPFDENIVTFLDHFSRHLFHNPNAKAWPDVISLAFWCRKSSIRQMQKAYPDLSARRGRGLAFHISPSNVAVNFAYSLLAGLLSGNVNVVRVPSKDFIQIVLICEALNAVLEEHQHIAPYLCVIRYGREKAINDLFSSLCQTRLIWGGDDTISALRRSPLPPRGLDLAFANRYSFALIDSVSYLSVPDKRGIAERFYNDTFLTDQNACTSPGLVVWLGDSQQTEKAREIFWTEFETYSREKYELQAIMAVQKLTRLYKLFSSVTGAKKASGNNNLVVRVLLDKIDQETINYLGAGGYFLEYQANNISDIYSLCADERWQTLSVLGVNVEVVKNFLDSYHVLGIDRVVPMGQTMNFALQWDGYDLIYMLTRNVTVTQ